MPLLVQLRLDELPNHAGDAPGRLLQRFYCPFDPPDLCEHPLRSWTSIGDGATLRIVTATGIKVATHRRAPAGAEQTLRASEHATQLERAVLDAFTTQTACRAKTNRPPGETALAELAKLHGQSTALAPVVSLSDYAALAEVAC